MSSKYHVNKATGDYGVCEAKIACPFGENADHYDDKEEAMYQSEVVLANNLGLFKKKKKVVMPTINETYSFPQADRLDRLAETVDAVSLGSNDSESLSASISTVSRQALYYADAASYLGFLEHDKANSKKKVYALTESGKSFIEASEKDRDKMFRHAIEENPAVKTYLTNGERAASAYIAEHDNSNEETVERKMQTVKAWASKLSSKSSVLNYDNELSERSEKGNETADKEVQGEICMSCFMVKPLTGVCPNCDE